MSRRGACAPRHAYWKETLGRVDLAHAQTDPTLTVDLEHLDLHDVAFLELVADALHALVRDLRDVHEAVASRQDRDERAKVHEPHDLTFVNSSDFYVGRDELDAFLCLSSGRTVDRCDLDGAVVLDVDRGAGLFGDAANDCTALADDLADLLRIDLHRDDRGSPIGHLLARRLQHL